MSTSSKRRSRLALLVLSALLAACSDEPLVSGDGRLTRSTPAPIDKPSAGPSAAPSAAPSAKPTPFLKSLLVVPSEVSLTSDPSAPPSSRGANLAAIAVLSNDQQVSTTVAWTVAPSGLVAINAAGYVSTLADAPSGTATVTASSGSVQATASVRVTGKALTVTSLGLSNAGLTLYAPAADGVNSAGLPTSARLGAVVTMSDLSTTSAVTWSSSDEAVARVDAMGLVTSVGAGTARVTARAAQDPAKALDCAVTVKSQGLVDVTVE